MRKYTLEQNLLAVFPLIYGILLWPFENAALIFTTPRLILVFFFIIVMPIIKVRNNKTTHLKDLPGNFAKQPKYVWALLLFTLSIIPSVLLSPDVGHALFGSIDFQTGGLFIFTISIIFLIYSTGPMVPNYGLILLGIILNVVVILEYIGFRPLSFVTSAYHPLSTSFPAATIGHRGQLAGLLVLFPLLALAWFRKKYTDWKFYSLFTLSIAGLGCTTNSSALIGLVAALSVFCFIKFKDLGLKIIPIIILVMISYNSYQYFKPLNSYFYELGWVSAKSDAKSIEDTTTLSTRLILWKAAIRMFEVRPVFGWGPQLFNQYWFSYFTESWSG